MWFVTLTAYIRMYHCNTKLLPSLFSDNECDRIIDLVEHFKTEAAQVGGDNNTVTNKKIRKCDVVWIPELEVTTWLRNRIETAFREANEELYGFELDYLEKLQYLKYQRLNFFKPHFDLGEPGIATRKLTMSVQLSQPNEYWGGNLSVRDITGTVVASKQRGDVIIFPTYLLHHAHTIYFGTRQCLVAWMHGATPLR